MGTSRRDSLALLAAGTFGLGWCDTTQAATEPPPETTRIRLNKIRSICLAPAYVAETLLRAEGFTDVQYAGDGPAGIGGRWRRRHWPAIRRVPWCCRKGGCCGATGTSSGRA